MNGIIDCKRTNYITSIRLLVVICLTMVALQSQAQTPPAPTYSVSVGSGSFSPNPICGGMTATASLTGSLNVQNPNQEIQESGDSWGWSPVVTGYAADSQSAFGALPSGTIPPSVSATSGSATTTVSATADQTTSPGYYQVTVTGTDSFTLTDSSISPPTVTSQSLSATTTLEITVVTIGDIQYNDPDNGWVSIPSDFVAMDGTTSPVRAMPVPSDASFPSGQPVWGGIASGSGTTATATFSTDSTDVGDETITATLGSTTSQAVSAAHAASTSAASPTPLQVSRQATTFKLTPKLLPSVTFPGRSVTSFGVGEEVTLDFNVVPIGTPMPETVWSIQGLPRPGGGGSSTGQLLDDGAVGERGEFWAGAKPGSDFTFKLAVTSGPSKGKSVASANISVVAPNSQTFEDKDFSYGDYHYQGDASAGFVGVLTLLPGNVSFTRTQFGEVNCVPSSATGSLVDLASSPHMSGVAIGSAKWRDVSIDPKYGNTPTIPYDPNAPSNPDYGKIVKDAVRLDLPPHTSSGQWENAAGQWVTGDVTFQIPWLYHVYNLDGSTTTDQKITVVSQVGHVSADGSATHKKSNASSLTQLLDSTNLF